jgi:transposase
LAKALEGRVKPHRRFELRELLCQIDSLDEMISGFDAEIETYCRPFEEAVERLDTMPGVGRQTAEIIVAEIGADMTCFPSARQLCAWAGVAPGNDESAGKRRSGKTRKGDRALRSALVQAAHAASHTKNTYLGALYHRIAARRGKKRAIIAVAHAILTSVYHMLVRKQNYQDLGSDCFDRRNPQATVKRLARRIEKPGYRVKLQLESIPVAA